MPAIDEDAYRVALLHALASRGVTPDEICIREDEENDKIELHTVVAAYGTASYSVSFLTPDEALDLDEVARGATAEMTWQGQPEPDFAPDPALLDDDGEPVTSASDWW